MAKPKSPKRKEETPINTTAAVTAPAETVRQQQPVKAEGTRETSKLEVVRYESRASVVPINLEDEIRCRAYELSQIRGFISGHETEDWLAAENEVLQRYRQQSA